MRSLASSVVGKLAVVSALLLHAGCATQKESHTPRTGVEQLLISGAVDQALDKYDLTPIANRNVFLETKYLDCVDKNYILVALHQRLLAQHVRMVDKPEAAEVVVEVASGAVGTDAQELFVGIPEIPLPPPSPISIPRLALFTRSRMNGTAKILVVAYDAKSKAPIINQGSSLARSDQNNWNVLGAGPIQTGTVPEQITQATGGDDFDLGTLARKGKGLIAPDAGATPETSPIRNVYYKP